MLAILPPSRGQTSAPDGAAPLDLESLALPELASARRSVLDALVGTPFQAHDLPAARAADVFTGVLYSAAGLPRILSRPGPAAQRAAADVLIASPLLGFVSPADRLPATRLAMGHVDGIGGLGGYWRPHLTAAIEQRAAGELIVDVRSSEFTPLWKPPADACWVSVRIVQDVDGTRRVVSPFAKHLRGVLIHHLLTRRGNEPTDLRSLVRAAQGLIRTGEITGVESEPAQRSGQPHVLTLVSP